MDERTLQKKLKWLGAAAAVISVIILAGGLLASYYLRNILGQALTEQMKSDADQYKTNILRRLDADFQTLNSLAAFQQYSDMDAESFIRGFAEIKEYNNYDRVGLFGSPGADPETGVMIRSGIVEDIAPASLDRNMKKVIEQAWKGKSGVSRIYQEASGETMFACAVPVRSGEAVTGALAATVSTDVFLDILQDDSILGRTGYVHIISDSGKVLVRSENRVVSEELDTIYDKGYILPDEKVKIDEAMAEGRACLSSFTYKGNAYRVLIEPLGINGWYLFCVQTTHGVSRSIYNLMTNMPLITGGILLLLLFIIAWGYRLISQGNRKLIWSIYYDSLTGAYNRMRFEYEIGPAVRTSGKYSLAALNIRQFKFINEIFGSRAADDLLCHIKKIISENVRSGEYYCRSSEDMFYLFLTDTDRERICERLDRIIEEIGAFRFGGRRDYEILMYCGVVIGTEVPDEAPDVRKSMTHVRFALNTARASLKNNIRFYDAKLHEKEVLENYVETHMNQALENREFKMFLQPKIDLQTGAVGGAEALVRWITDTGGIISPGQFIPIFEANGFCASLDLYMAEQVCRQIRLWIDGGTVPVPLSVNQSRLLFYETGYIEKMKSLADRYRIPENMITLEILEGLAAENTDELNEKICRLRELGFRISMDDFGSGYSSLNTLAGLNIDELKFDRNFLLALKDASADPDRQTVIMKGIVDLTKKLKIKTVVEGVETKAHEELVRSLGCEYGQGYYYGRPVSVMAFSEKYLKRKRL